MSTSNALPGTNNGGTAPVIEQHQPYFGLQQQQQPPPLMDTMLPDLATAAKRQLERNVSTGASSSEGAESQKKRAKVNAEEQWNAMLERLRAWRDQFGHCNVPKRFPELYVCVMCFVNKKCVLSGELSHFVFPFSPYSILIIC